MEDIVIKVASEENISDILKLLVQVNQVHADGRPDLFKSGGTKYTHESLKEKLSKEDEVIFVALDGEEVVGYTFCVFEETEDTVNTFGKKTLYIDDLCVDENHRRMGIGESLYAYTRSFAKENGFDRVTLHVWECNPNAYEFYKALGMTPMYTAMEDIIEEEVQPKGNIFSGLKKTIMGRINSLTEAKPNKKVYVGLDEIPTGKASDKITKGCIILEGGAFRGLYSQGVTDAMMENGINMSCVIGVSAGAMSGLNYVSGDIGRSARINLKYRHDNNYVGMPAFKDNQGLIGFDFVFNGINEEFPFDEERFNSGKQRFVVVATDYVTGKPMYFEKDNCDDMFKAVQASASLPYLSRPVEVNGRHYLDGGCANAIPVDWALEQGFDKIILVRTRDVDYRKNPESRDNKMATKFYHRTPEFAKTFSEAAVRYNNTCDRIIELEKEGKLYVIAPTKPVEVKRVESDLNKLGDLYYEGYNELYEQLDELKAYLEI